MNNDVIMNKFRASMKALTENDMEVVSNNLHKNNVRIEQNLKYAHIVKQPKFAKMCLG